MSSIQFVNAASIIWVQSVDVEGVYSSESNTRTHSFKNPLSDLWEKDKRYKPTTDGLVFPLSRGWNTADGTIAVEKATPAQIKAAKAQCKEQLRVWREQGLTALADTAERHWESADFEYVANMCFRRGFAIPAAVHVRNYENDTPQFDYQVSIEIVEYESDLERHLAHAAENLQKTEGASAYEPLDLVEIAKRVVEAGGREADLVREGLKRGQAQKCFAIAKLDARFPSVKLIERLNMPEPLTQAGKPFAKPKYDEAGHIPYGPLDTTKMRHLVNGSKRDNVEKADDPKTIEEFIKGTVKGVIRTRPMMSKSRLSEMDTHKVKLVRVLADAVIDNKEKVFGDLVKHADALNALTDKLGITK